MNRSAGRDVHLYNPNGLVKPLGGLILSNSITNANFYAIFYSTFALRHDCHG